MVDGCNAVAKDQAFEDMVAQRDREIVGVLNALRQARLMWSFGGLPFKVSRKSESEPGQVGAGSSLGQASR